MSEIKFTMRKLNEKARTDARLKSVFRMKPVKPVKPKIIPITETEPPETEIETLYFYITWEPY